MTNFHNCQISNYNLTRQTDSRSADLKIFFPLWNSIFDYRIQNRLILDPIVSKTNHVNILTPYFCNPL